MKYEKVHNIYKRCTEIQDIDPSLVRKPFCIPHKIEMMDPFILKHLEVLKVRFENLYGVVSKQQQKKKKKTRIIHHVCFHNYEPPHEKTNNVVFEQIRHKPGSTATEDSYKLEISDLRRRGIVLSE